MLKRKAAVILAMATMFVQPVFAQNINVFVNNELVTFSNQQPEIVDGRTLIPLRGVFENLGYNVEWEPNTKTAEIFNDRYFISVQVNAPLLYVNRMPVELDVPAQIINGSMMIPLRAIGESAGISVDWDAQTKSAYISSQSSVSEITDNELIANYLDSYNQTIGKPMMVVYDDLQQISGTTDIDQLKTAVQNLNTTVTQIKTNINSLVPPEGCEKIHDSTLQNINLIEEFADYTLGLSQNPQNVTADDKVKLQEYMQKINSLNDQMESALKEFVEYIMQ